MKKLVSIALALLIAATPARANVAFTDLVNQSFISHTVDAGLLEIATQRAIETSIGFDPISGIAPNFNHNGMRTDSEVLAWNMGLPDPYSRLIDQWRASVVHNGILMDPAYGQIGCGTHEVSGATFAACVVMRGGTTYAPTYVAPVVSAPTPMPPVKLPNTAVDAP
jgi:hypothetical protein